MNGAVFALPLEVVGTVSGSLSSPLPSVPFDSPDADVVSGGTGSGSGFGVFVGIVGSGPGFFVKGSGSGSVCFVGDFVDVASTVECSYGGTGGAGIVPKINLNVVASFRVAVYSVTTAVSFPMK